MNQQITETPDPRKMLDNERTPSKKLLSIERRPLLIFHESYFVLNFGGKTYELETSAVKSILLMWVFFAVVFFTYAIGVYTAQENVKMTAYLLKGNITNDKGEPVSCSPVLITASKVDWKCTTNLTGDPSG